MQENWGDQAHGTQPLLLHASVAVLVQIATPAVTRHLALHSPRFPPPVHQAPHGCCCCPCGCPAAAAAAAAFSSTARSWDHTSGGESRGACTGGRNKTHSGIVVMLLSRAIMGGSQKAIAAVLTVNTTGGPAVDVTHIHAAKPRDIRVSTE